MKLRLNAISIAVAASMIGACSTTGMLTESDALAKYKNVGQLSQGIHQVDNEKMALLSNNSYSLAENSLKQAKALAVEDDPKAIETAALGLDHLEKAIDNAERAEDIFSEVLEARDQALLSTNDTSAKKLKEIESDFQMALKQWESGKHDLAKRKRIDLVNRYQSVEKSAIKNTTIERARAEIEQAKSIDIDDYAEKTMAMAEQELVIAERMLETDKDLQSDAQIHVDKSVWLVNQATHIADIVKEFKGNDFELEDVVLWYQSQLTKAVKPFGETLPFDRSNKQVIGTISRMINDLNTDVSSLQDEKAVLITDLEVTKEKLQVAMHQQRTDFESQLGQIEKKKRRLEFTQALFSSKEANVYNQSDDLLIRAHGFYFAPGQSEIDSRNFALLQKISKVIGEYPGAKLVVIGHTDSSGDDELNLNLSKNRAQKVANFLREFSNLPVELITSDGFGEQQPVATNASKEGRSANRRIEVIIKPKDQG